MRSNILALANEVTMMNCSHLNCKLINTALHADGYQVKDTESLLFNRDVLSGTVVGGSRTYNQKVNMRRRIVCQ